MRKMFSIVCCCSNGLGSSMIMELNLKKALERLGRTDIPLRHVSLSEADSSSDDLYVAGLDIAPQLKNFKKVVIIQNIVSTEECVEKLGQALSCKDPVFRIG